MKQKQIIWTEYDQKLYQSNDDDIELDDEDDEISHIFADKEDHDGVNFALLDKLDLGHNISMTPFGDFHKNHPMNPINLYTDIYWGHLYNFSINNSNFYTVYNGNKEFTLDLIDGIGTWKLINQHLIIVAMAKFFDWPTVSHEIKVKLIGEDNDNMNETILQCRRKSKSFGDQKHIVLALPNKNIVTCTDEGTKFDVFKAQAMEILKNDPDEVYLIIDGVKINTGDK